MTKITRRKLLAAATFPLLAGTLSGAVSAPAKPAPVYAAKADPVIAKVAAWMGEHEAREAMMLEWQDWENELCDKMRSTPKSLTRAMRSRQPEARAMRKLDRRIKAAGKRLDRAAAQIILTKASSVQGALAKIEMGVKLQGPYDWEEYAYALVLGGIEHMRNLV